MKNNKAQALIGFLIIFAFLMVLYFLTMPAQERAELLGQDYTQDNSNSGNTFVFEEDNLLFEYPGLLSLDSGEVDHNLNSMNLFVKNEPRISDLVSNVQVSRSWFSDKSRTLTFRINDLINLDESILIFSVEEGNVGDLKIHLNDNLIYGGFIPGLEMIDLPIEYLKEVNKLEFSTSFSFLRKTHYSLKNIKLKKQFEISNSRSIQSFVVIEDEKTKLDSSLLKYHIYCNSLETENTPFSIYLNNQRLSSEFISCSEKDMSLELNKNFVRVGSNDLMFMISEGDFLIDQVKVINSLSGEGYKSYTFSISESQAQEILENSKAVSLDMGLFGNFKQAQIYINGYALQLDTIKDSYVEDISGLVKLGRNTIQIVPQVEFRVGTLEINLI